MQRNNRFDSARLRLVLTMELCEAKFIHHLLARGQQNNIMTEITWLVAAFGLTLLGGYAVGNQEAVIEPQGSIRIEDEGHSRHDLLTSPKTGSLSPPYGTGCSWPTHHTFVSEHSNPLGSQARQSAYDTFMNGCFGDNLKFQQECLRWEQDRISMALNQPAASQNYTHAGYAKVETPPSVGRMLREFWEDNRDKGEYELWDHSNTYVNHWENPTTMVDINHLEFGLPESLQWEIVNAVQSVLEAWTGQPLVLTSMYGIRVYKEGSILAPHVDRLPLVSSAIINVAQDLEADWPLEVIGHDGVARNLTIGVDDMILYESHSVIHGRPFPLKGKFCANIFIHFEPLGHSIRHMQRGGYGSDVFKSSYPATARSNYERALENKTARRNQATQEATDEEMEAPSPFLPPYVNPDKEVRWRQQFEYEKETTIAPKPTKDILGHVNVHHAAADGMLDVLKEIATKDRAKLFGKDHNGWRPLHEAARGGRAEVVEYLLKEGAQVNERTNHGAGGNPLWWAEKQKAQNTETIRILKKYGGVSLAPRQVKTTKSKQKSDSDVAL